MPHFEKVPQINEFEADTFTEEDPTENKAARLLRWMEALSCRLALVLTATKTKTTTTKTEKKKRRL